MVNLPLEDKFEVTFVKDGRLLEKAQSLRHKVFFKSAGIDKDKFDKFCEHLIVVDKSTRRVVGTYRLLLGSKAIKNKGFYSETEFNLINIRKNCRGQLLEIGRACVDTAHRRYPVINLMWNAILSLVEQEKIRFVFGCASVDKPSPEKIGTIFRFFRSRFFSSPRLRVYPLEGRVYPYTDNGESLSPNKVLRLLPSLIKGYLKMGAIVCGEPVWDKEFNTADFFMLLNTKKTDSSFKSKFI